MTRDVFRRRLVQLEAWRGRRGRTPQPILLCFGDGVSHNANLASYGLGRTCRCIRYADESMADFEYRATAAALDAHRPGAPGPIVIFTHEAIGAIGE